MWVTTTSVIRNLNMSRMIKETDGSIKQTILTYYGMATGVVITVRVAR